MWTGTEHVSVLEYLRSIIIYELHRDNNMAIEHKALLELAMLELLRCWAHIVRQIRRRVQRYENLYV
jgi:hypothetical protein